MCDTCLPPEDYRYTMSDQNPPSFELTADHIDLRDWLHTFATDVMRPAASEWDEREE